MLFQTLVLIINKIKTLIKTDFAIWNFTRNMLPPHSILCVFLINYVDTKHEHYVDILSLQIAKKNIASQKIKVVKIVMEKWFIIFIINCSKITRIFFRYCFFVRSLIVTLEHVNMQGNVAILNEVCWFSITIVSFSSYLLHFSLAFTSKNCLCNCTYIIFPHELKGHESHRQSFQFRYNTFVPIYK